MSSIGHFIDKTTHCKEVQKTWSSFCWGNPAPSSAILKWWLWATLDKSWKMCIWYLFDISSSVPDIEIISKSSNNSTTCSGRFLAKIMKEYGDHLAFSLTILWRKSLDTGYIPDGFVSQLVVPVFKTGNKSQAVNYRPIFLPISPNYLREWCNLELLTSWKAIICWFPTSTVSIWVGLTYTAST